MLSRILFVLILTLPLVVGVNRVLAQPATVEQAVSSEGGKGITLDPNATHLRPGEVTAALPDGAGDAALWFIGRIETPWTLRADCPRRGDAAAGPACRLILDPRWVVQNPGHRGPVGTFSIRSPNRPNPIAVSSVTILAVEGAVVTVRGLDCLDGTPLIDLKPEHCPHAG